MKARKKLNRYEKNHTANGPITTIVTSKGDVPVWYYDAVTIIKVDGELRAYDRFIDTDELREILG